MKAFRGIMAGLALAAAVIGVGVPVRGTTRRRTASGVIQKKRDPQFREENGIKYLLWHWRKHRPRFRPMTGKIAVVAEALRPRPRCRFKGANKAKRDLIRAARSLGWKGRTYKGAKKFENRIEKERLGAMRVG
jgi:hypothetical protein